MNRFVLFLLLTIQFSLINAQELCKTPSEMNGATKSYWLKV